MAKLYFKYGAMNSGKSLELLRVARNYSERNQIPVVIKPAIDSIENSLVHSRVGISIPAVVIDKDEKIYPLLPEKVDCILVDEAQFLTRNQVDELMKIVISGIPVICYGLRTDYLSHSFEGSKRLLEIAHEIEEIKTICHCGAKATFTHKNERTSEDIIDIEDLSNPKYISLCSSCYNKETRTWD